MVKLSEKLKRRIVIALTSEKYGKELIDAVEHEMNPPNVYAGVASLADASSEFTVSLPIELPSSDYVLVVSISNTVDPTVRHLNPTITGKTTTSFTFHTSQTTDHANYKVNYFIAY